MKPSKDQVGGDHYKAYAIQPAEFIHKNAIGFLEGNVIKYVCRHAAKHGRADLLKAKHYIELLLEWQYGDDGQTTPAQLKPTTLLDITAAGRDEAGAAIDNAADYLLQCICGWSGKQSQLRKHTMFRVECPKCGVEFKPLIAVPQCVVPTFVRAGQTWQVFEDRFPDPDLVGELTEAERGAGLLPDHAPKPELCSHGLTICKVCEQKADEFGFPPGASYGGTSSD